MVIYIIQITNITTFELQTLFQFYVLTACKEPLK